MQDGLSCLRRKLKAYIKSLKKGKIQQQKQAAQLAKEVEKIEQRESRRLEIHESWPKIVPQDLKEKIVEKHNNNNNPI